MSDNHELFMFAALKEAEAALAGGEFPVGCVIVSAGEIVARGGRQHSRQSSAGPASELDHAEINALRALRRQQPLLSTEGVTIYSTMEPCLMCYSTLLVNGIRRFIYAYEDVMGGGTNLPLERLSPLYRNMRPVITPGVLRSESLALFKNFFGGPQAYLRGTILAQYTLNA
ncbi:nucleoside deaminase [Desulfobacterota bacterium M19]